MRTTVTVDDDLFADAVEITGIKERSALFRHALEALVASEAARQLARMGGSDPDAKASPRRRFDWPVILADSSVWIDHFRHGEGHLAVSLDADAITCHPFVIGELALGSLRHRKQILSRLARLQQLAVTKIEIVRELIESKSLYGKGVGYVDCHLLTATRLKSGTLLWTRDKRLHAQAEKLGIAFTPWPPAIPGHRLRKKSAWKTGCASGRSI